MYYICIKSNQKPLKMNTIIKDRLVRQFKEHFAEFNYLMVQYTEIASGLETIEEYGSAKEALAEIEAKYETHHYLPRL